MIIAYGWFLPCGIYYCLADCGFENQPQSPMTWSESVGFPGALATLKCCSLKPQEMTRSLCLFRSRRKHRSTTCLTLQAVGMQFLHRTPGACGCCNQCIYIVAHQANCVLLRLICVANVHSYFSILYWNKADGLQNDSVCDWMLRHSSDWPSQFCCSNNSSVIMYYESREHHW